MAFKAPGKLRIPQWSIVNRLITAEDVTFNQYGSEVSRGRTDLTGGVVYFTVRDENDVIVLQKDSTVTAEIEHKNQLVAATTGQATLKFVYADTAPLSSDPKTKYWFDIWVMTADGREEPIVDRGRFYVDRSATHIALGPAPALPTYPAAQNQQERSFKWTAPTTGDTFTITIPGTGMVDTVYTIPQPGFATIPSGGSWTPTHCPETQRTSTTFQLLCNSAILAGTVLDFQLRDA